jgi:hypothetical protein
MGASASEPEYKALVQEKWEAATREISKPNGTGVPVEQPTTIPTNDLARPVESAATTTPPQILTPNFTPIPSELTTLAQWVCWRRTERDGKRTKLPVMPSGKSADSTNPATWRTFDEVVAAYQGGGFDGIGFVFAGQHWGADFDHVTDAGGRFLDPDIEQEVRALVAAGAYCERSPSDTGLHVIGLYRGEPLPGKKTGIREGYVNARYFTMTGCPVPGIESPAVLSDTTTAFLAWRAQWFKSDDKTEAHDWAPTTMQGPCTLNDLTLDERDAIARHLTENKDFAVLWAGEYSACLGPDGTPDRSKADMALCCILAKLSRDPERLEHMARCSALYRDKWDRPDYLPRTIKKALKDTPTGKDEFDRVESAPSTTTTDATPGKTPRLFYELLDHVAPALDQQALIKDLLAVAAMSVLYGESNSGKTFVALSLAFCIAANLRWMGRAVHSGLVIYVAAEAGGGARKRLAALRVEYGAQARGAPLALVPCPIDLSGRGVDVQPLLDLMTQAVTKTGRPLVLVVIDTLSRAMGGGNENAPEDMTAFIKNVDRIRAATKAHVMVIHHSGKDRAKGARGHSSLRAATDTELEIADKTILVTKQRDMEQGAPIGFDLKPLVIGHDSQGAPITSCVVVPRNLTAEHDFATGRIKPGSVPGKALAVLEDLTAGVGTILIDTWKDRFISAHYTGHSKAGWTAFERAREALRKSGAVIEVAGRVSCAR